MREAAYKSHTFSDIIGALRYVSYDSFINSPIGFRDKKKNKKNRGFRRRRWWARFSERFSIPSGTGRGYLRRAFFSGRSGSGTRSKTGERFARGSAGNRKTAETRPESPSDRPWSPPAEARWSSGRATVINATVLAYDRVGRRARDATPGYGEKGRRGSAEKRRDCETTGSPGKIAESLAVSAENLSVFRSGDGYTATAEAAIAAVGKTRGSAPLIGLNETY